MVVKENVPLCAHQLKGICYFLCRVVSLVYYECEDHDSVFHKVCQVGECLFAEMFLRNDSLFGFCGKFSLPIFHHRRYNNTRGRQYSGHLDQVETCKASCAKFHTLALETIGGKA